MDKTDELLQQLDDMDKNLLEYSKRIMKPGTGFHSDHLSIGVVNRSLYLNYGFTTLMRSKNYMTAVHLVRLHLDNYLRYSALWLVENPEEFSYKVINGTHIRDIKERTGKNFMTDRYLVTQAALNHEWMTKVYEDSSGFVHLSFRHVNTSRKVDFENNRIVWTVSKFDKNVPEESREEATECMLEITRCVKDLLEGWCRSKENTQMPDNAQPGSAYGVIENP